MINLFEKRPVSDHILISTFPAAKEKGEVCVFGSLIGFSDYKTAQGEQGSVNIGKYASVFQAAKSDLPASPAVGMDIYITSAGAASATATGNTLLGTIVAVGSDTADIAVIG